MFKKKNKMLLASAILIALAGNTAYADCVDDIQANLADGDATNNPSDTAIALCGVQLNSTPGTNPNELIALLEIVENSPEYSAAAAGALLSNDPAVAQAGAASFNTILNNPTIPPAIKSQASVLAAKIIVDNIGSTFTGANPSNSTITDILVSITAISPNAVSNAVAVSTNPAAGAVATTFIATPAIQLAAANFNLAAVQNLGLAGSTQTLSDAANNLRVSGTGLGQVLLFPYYTTRDKKRSLINIFNTSNRTVAAKVRLHESHNSRDVLDFTVILSPFDKWAGTIKEGANGPILLTGDSTCTAPAIPKAGEPLKPAAYNNALTGDVDEDQTEDRLREGYVEVIAMGDATEAVMNANRLATIGGNAGGFAPAANNVVLAAGETGNVAYNAKHVRDGDDTTPRNCVAVVAAFNNASTAYPANDGQTGSPAAVNQFRPLQSGNNPLRGALTIISEENGVGFGANAVAIADFNNSVNLISSQRSPYFHEPTIASRNGLWTTTGLAAVEATMSYSTIINEWAHNPNNGSDTDWVIQFPTKAFHVDVPYANKATLSGCRDNNVQAARNIFRGNLDCSVSAAGASSTVAAAQAEVVAKTTALGIVTSVASATQAQAATAAAAAAAAPAAATAAGIAAATAAGIATTSATAVTTAIAVAALSQAAYDAALFAGIPATIVAAKIVRDADAATVITLTTQSQIDADAATATAAAATAATAAIATTQAAANAAAAAANAANAATANATADLAVANALLVAAQTAATGANASQYFDNLGSFENRFSTKGSAITLTTRIIDKEENMIGVIPGEVSFSPENPDTPNIAVLPWESNVVTFSGTNGKSVLSSETVDLALDPTSNAQLTEVSGMAMISFADNVPKAVIGFVAKQRDEGDKTLSFGQLMSHSYR